MRSVSPSEAVTENGPQTPVFEATPAKPLTPCPKPLQAGKTGTQGDTQATAARLENIGSLFARRRAEAINGVSDDGCKTARAAITFQVSCNRRKTSPVTGGHRAKVRRASLPQGGGDLPPPCHYYETFVVRDSRQWLKCLSRPVRKSQMRANPAIHRHSGESGLPMLSGVAFKLSTVGPARCASGKSRQTPPRRTPASWRHCATRSRSLWRCWGLKPCGCRRRRQRKSRASDRHGPASSPDALRPTSCDHNPVRRAGEAVAGPDAKVLPRVYRCA